MGEMFRTIFIQVMIYFALIIKLFHLLAFLPHPPSTPSFMKYFNLVLRKKLVIYLCLCRVVFDSDHVCEKINFLKPGKFFSSILFKREKCWAGYGERVRKSVNKKIKIFQ